MAKDVSTGLTRHSAARFGRVVGSAFVLFAAIAFWRDHGMAFRILAAAGALLLTLAFAAPRWLVPVERGWMAMAHAISRVTTPVMMGVLFFVLMTPLGLVRRAIGRHGLPRFAAGQSAWQPRAAGQTRSDLNRQF